MGEELKPPQPDTSRHASRPSWLLLKALPGVFRRASREWFDDNAPRLGAAVAFYALLSMAPVIVIAVAVAAAVYGQDAAQGRLASEIRGLAGPDVARTIQEIIKGAYQPRTGVIATLLGVATLAFGATSMFVELHDAMNTIWDVPLPQDRTNAATVIRPIRDSFYSFATVMGIGSLLLVSLLWKRLDRDHEGTQERWEPKAAGNFEAPGLEPVGDPAVAHQVVASRVVGVGGHRHCCPGFISSSREKTYFASPQFPATCPMLVTLNMLFCPDDLVPLTCTLRPRYLAKTSLSVPADCGLVIFSIISSSRTYWPSCLSIQPVKICCATGPAFFAVGTLWLGLLAASAARQKGIPSSNI
jgi:hypothetical protein